MTDTGVVDEIDHHRFAYEEDGRLAQLVYQAEPGRLVLVHTEVPEELGGRGIAGRLVQAAVERAAASGETIAPWCPYARKWLSDHKEAAHTVAIDWRARPS